MAGSELALQQQVSQAVAHAAEQHNLYVNAATANSTRQAYQTDIAHFEAWGGALPASPSVVVAYLQHFANQLNPRTLSRRLVALKHWHVYQGFVDPTQSPLVKKVMQGIHRLHGTPKNKAQALTLDQLILIHRSLKGQDSLRALRDNALLQIGFFGAFRVSELLAIHVEHLKITSEGIRIIIPRSKTDPTGQGQSCAIPSGDETMCPIRTLQAWLEKSHIQQGPIFRFISRWQRIGKKAISPLSVNRILKNYAKQLHFPNPEFFSSHSMRRGLATAASQQGASLKAIMRQGRWKEVKTVLDYIDDANAFQDNAAQILLQKNISDIR
jgi:site-specific recombinase XerD